MTRIITAAEVTPIIRRIVEEAGPGFHYDSPIIGGSCYYRTPVSEDGYFNEDHTAGEPGCIVGQVLDALGVLPAELFACSSKVSSDITPDQLIEGALAAGAIRLIAEVQDLEFDPVVVEALGIAQTRQDAHETWDMALHDYEDSLRMYGALHD